MPLSGECLLNTYNYLIYNFVFRAVVSELVETEQEFVRDLQFVVQKYLLGLERDPTKVPKSVKDNLDLVFGNLDQIAEFHKS